MGHGRGQRAFWGSAWGRAQWPMIQVLCPMTLSYVLWACPMSYGPVLCPMALSYVPWPCPTFHGPVLCPMALPHVPMGSACCITHRGVPFRVGKLPAWLRHIAGLGGFARPNGNCASEAQLGPYLPPND